MKKILLPFLFFTLTTISSTALACTFSWYHYGDTEVYKRISNKIGAVVTDEYCKKYNKNYQIVVITNAYTSNSESLGHSSVGFRKRGTKDVPVLTRNGYRSKPGNFVIATAYDLATTTAIDNLMDAMSALDEYVPN